MGHAKRCSAATAAIILIVGSMASNRPITAQQQACLHGSGETETQAARRKQAIGVTRQINTAQAVASSGNRAYHGLSQLQITNIPEGFAVHMVTDAATGYVFSMKDTLDPCRFALFSDETGLIYTAQPLQ